MDNFVHCKEMPQVGTKGCIDLNSAFIFSSYYIVTPLDAIQQNTERLLTNLNLFGTSKKSKTYILRKLDPPFS